MDSMQYIMSPPQVCDCADCRRRKPRLWQEYGLCLFDVFALNQHQESRCGICQEPWEYPQDGNCLYGNWVVDHDHTTGKVRGLLHSRCNTSIEEAHKPNKRRDSAYKQNPPANSLWPEGRRGRNRQPQRRPPGPNSYSWQQRDYRNFLLLHPEGCLLMSEAQLLETWPKLRPDDLVRQRQSSSRSTAWSAERNPEQLAKYQAVPGLIAAINSWQDSVTLPESGLMPQRDDWFYCPACQSRVFYNWQAKQQQEQHCRYCQQELDWVEMRKHRPAAWEADLEIQQRCGAISDKQAATLRRKQKAAARDKRRRK